MIFLQNSTQGSVLLGAISYGKLSFADQGENKNPEKHPTSYPLSYVVPPNKVSHCLKKLSPLTSLWILYNCTSHGHESWFERTPSCAVVE